MNKEIIKELEGLLREFYLHAVGVDDFGCKECKKYANKIFSKLQAQKEDFIKVDPRDIQTLLHLLNGGVERQRIINYIVKYIYDPE